MRLVCHLRFVCPEEDCSQNSRFKLNFSKVKQYFFLERPVCLYLGDCPLILMDCHQEGVVCTEVHLMFFFTLEDTNTIPQGLLTLCSLSLMEHLFIRRHHGNLASN